MVNASTTHVLTCDKCCLDGFLLIMITLKRPLINESHHNVAWVLIKRLVKVAVRYLYPLHASSKGDTQVEFKPISLAATQKDSLTKKQWEGET